MKGEDLAVRRHFVGKRSRQPKEGPIPNKNTLRRRQGPEAMTTAKERETGKMTKGKGKGKESKNINNPNQKCTVGKNCRCG